MSVVYGIVKNHGGYIDIKSRPGEGTKTTVYIPASKAEEAEEEKEIYKAEGGKETILVIDDEDKVLSMIKDILGDAGYIVYTENTGEAGLKILKEKLDQVDLVILDIAMPDMRCENILNRIFEIDKNMRVLLASGYSDEDQHNELIKMGAHGFIGKPFLADRLLVKIREMFL
jgi:DNA-binding NtrC family response regulator